MPDTRSVPQELCKSYRPGFFQPGYKEGGLFYLVGSAKDTVGGAQRIAQGAVVYVKGATAMVFDCHGENLLNKKGELIKKKN